MQSLPIVLPRKDDKSSRSLLVSSNPRYSPASDALSMKFQKALQTNPASCQSEHPKSRKHSTNLCYNNSADYVHLDIEIKRSYLSVFVYPIETYNAAVAMLNCHIIQFLNITNMRVRRKSSGLEILDNQKKSLRINKTIQII